MTQNIENRIRVIPVKVNHLKRGRIKPFDLCEEIVDVEIILNQLKMRYDIFLPVLGLKRYKLVRLEKQFENEETKIKGGDKI